MITVGMKGPLQVSVADLAADKEIPYFGIYFTCEPAVAACSCCF